MREGWTVREGMFCMKIDVKSATRTSRWKEKKVINCNFSEGWKGNLCGETSRSLHERAKDSHQVKHWLCDH